MVDNRTPAVINLVAQLNALKSCCISRVLKGRMRLTLIRPFSFLRAVWIHDSAKRTGKKINVGVRKKDHVCPGTGLRLSPRAEERHDVDNANLLTLAEL